MNVMIMTDLEGISGVESISQIFDIGSPGHILACQRLVADTNAAVEGAYRAGAEKVYVVDGHGGGNNFVDSLLDPRAVKVTNFSEIIQNDRDISAYLQVGAHAMPGTLNGFLDHVQSSATWYNYMINGVKYGEIVQGALFAGAYGIPCVMVSGDDAACAEARKCLGEQVACASVKRGVGRNIAECVSFEEAERRIRDAAEDGVRRAAQMPTFKLDLPLDIRLEFTRSDYCDECHAARPDTTRLDARTLQMTVDKIVAYSDLVIW